MPEENCEIEGGSELRAQALLGSVFLPVNGGFVYSSLESLIAMFIKMQFYQ